MELPVFDPGRYSLHEKTIRTAHGEKQVKYKLWRFVRYCANPVNTDYATMDIKAAYEINGVPCDTKNAPILLNIMVGGYFAVCSSEEKPLKDGPFAPDGGADGGRPKPYRPEINDKDELALAMGLVVVTPAVRGWNCVDENGRMFGNAPAVLVDFKAAIRYLRVCPEIPGDKEHILTSGGSAGGAVSALLGTTGNAPEFEPYLREIGAAEGRDDVFMAACYSPILNLENADGAYEWMFGRLNRSVYYRVKDMAPCEELEDQTLSAELRAGFAAWLETEQLHAEGFGSITAENLGAYLCSARLQPAASAFLLEKTPEERDSYLKANPWLHWDGTHAVFSFADYAAHCGRMKPLPAFDAFTMGTPENNLFGTEEIRGRHFTEFSQRHDPDAEGPLPEDLLKLRRMMNPMNYVGKPGCCQYWRVFHGSSDSDTAVAIPMLFALKLENAGKTVNAHTPWDGWHRSDDDPQGVIDDLLRLAKSC